MRRKHASHNPAGLLIPQHIASFETAIYQVIGTRDVAIAPQQDIGLGATVGVHRIGKPLTRGVGGREPDAGAEVARDIRHLNEHGTFLPDQAILIGRDGSHVITPIDALPRDRIHGAVEKLQRDDSPAIS